MEPIKVFLVEDERIVREGLRDMIPWEQYGFVFAGEAPDGEVALPMIRRIHPDILITDIKMPFMDGLSLSRLVAPRFKTSVQTLSATIQNVASRLLSSYLGGFLADLVGIRPLYLVSAILVSIIVVVFCGFILRIDEDTPVFEG